MRYAVVLAPFVLSMITYIDRVCISTAKDPISRELALSDSAKGMVLGAFARGYALAQIPAGWFADRFGARMALALVVTAWSALTALTGAAWSLSSLVAIRFLFGVGEAGAFPGSARAICNWLPAGERGRANGVLFSGSRPGAALAFPLLAWMLTRWHWRTAFLMLGALGVVWVLIWLRWFRDYPAGAPKYVAANGPTVPFGQVCRSPGMALAMLQYFASSFTFFICLSWMLPYLKAQYHLTDSQAASYADGAAPAGRDLAMDHRLDGGPAAWLASSRVVAANSRNTGVRPRHVRGPLRNACRNAGHRGTVLHARRLRSGYDGEPELGLLRRRGGQERRQRFGVHEHAREFGSFISANAFPYLQGATGSASAYFLAVLNLAGI
ncbi:MAG: MFS transporter [Candidatus Solibacter sp.]